MLFLVWLSHVSRACTALSKHGVGVEPLFWPDFWDRGRACARGGAGVLSSEHRFRLPFVWWLVVLWLLCPHFWAFLLFLQDQRDGVLNGPRAQPAPSEINGRRPTDPQTGSACVTPNNTSESPHELAQQNPPNQ